VIASGRDERAQSSRLAFAVEELRAGRAIELPVRGTSMLPLLRAGDVLVIEPARASSLRAGDVAFARRAADGTWVAHRVLATAPLILRGDSCGDDDGALASDDVVGRVVAFRRGTVRVPLDGRLGRALALACPLVGKLYLWKATKSLYRGRASSSPPRA